MSLVLYILLMYKDVFVLIRFLFQTFQISFIF